MSLLGSLIGGGQAMQQPPRVAPGTSAIEEAIMLMQQRQQPLALGNSIGGNDAGAKFEFAEPQLQRKLGLR